MSASTRDKVLNLLESSRDAFVSGEEIASELGISRTAVWKAVNSLKKDGYIIESVTKRGHRLLNTSDVLSEAAIRRYLQESGFALPADIDVFSKVDSTNTICIRRASSGESGHSGSIYAAIAGCQTHGRGRRGRSFFSPDGTGLYMSILLRPTGLLADQAVKYTTIAAVAVSEAIEAVTGKSASVKWVNDVYVAGRKACGILTEASFNPEDGTLDYAVVGIGINVYEPEGGFPEDIRDRAGSITGPQMRGIRNRLAAEILAGFFRYLSSDLTPLAGKQSADADSPAVPLYVEEYRNRCFVTGCDVDVLKAGSDPERALVLGLDDECRLLVRYEDGTEEALSSGEISIRL